jgi:transcriptional regulator with PAS, ATPase and Fis domain
VNVINIELPPLRSRMSDIPTLAHSFLEQVREDSRRQVTGFADDAMAMLERYHWPGNVRELQNVVERAVLLGKGPVITVADLPAEVRGSSGVMVSTAIGQKTLKEALEGPERQIIREVLESNGWNRNLTADQLGINRTTLYKKMKRLGLEDGRVGVM